MGSSGILAILDGLGLGLVVSLQLGLHLLDAGLGGLGGITSLLGHLGLELLHLSLELLTGSLTLGSIGSSCLGLLHGVGGVGSSIGSGLLVGSSGGIAELLGSLLGLGVGGVLDGGRISLHQRHRGGVAKDTLEKLVLRCPGVLNNRKGVGHCNKCDEQASDRTGHHLAE